MCSLHVLAYLQCLISRDPAGHNNAHSIPIVPTLLSLAFEWLICELSTAIESPVGLSAPPPHSSSPFQVRLSTSSFLAPTFLVSLSMSPFLMRCPQWCHLLALAWLESPPMMSHCLSSSSSSSSEPANLAKVMVNMLVVFCIGSRESCSHARRIIALLFGTTLTSMFPFLVQCPTACHGGDVGLPVQSSEGMETDSHLPELRLPNLKINMSLEKKHFDATRKLWIHMLPVSNLHSAHCADLVLLTVFFLISTRPRCCCCYG